MPLCISTHFFHLPLAAGTTVDWHTGGLPLLFNNHMWILSGMSHLTSGMLYEKRVLLLPPPADANGHQPDTIYECHEPEKL